MRSARSTAPGISGWPIIYQITGAASRPLKRLICFVALLCGCQVTNTRGHFFLMTLLLPDQRETCCHTWHGTRAVTLLCNASSLRHKAPGSLSRTANLQEASVSPGSAQRRVVPWGDVSSWVKGTE